MHNIDYTKLQSYKELIDLAPETTGQIQAKRGTIKFSRDKDFVIYPDGRISRQSKTHGGTFLNIPELSQRTEKDYNEAFQAIINRIKGIRRKSVGWEEQLKKSEHRIFTLLFSNNFVKNALVMLKKKELYYSHLVPKEKWQQWSFLKRLHFTMKSNGYIKKGRDYE